MSAAALWLGAAICLGLLVAFVGGIWYGVWMEHGAPHPLNIKEAEYPPLFDGERDGERPLFRLVERSGDAPLVGVETPEMVTCVGGPLDGRRLQAVPASRLIGGWAGEYLRSDDGERWIWHGVEVDAAEGEFERGELT